MFESRKAMATCAVGAIIAMSVANGAMAQSPSSEEEPVTFTVGVTYDLNSANPFRQIDAAEAFLSGLMYDDLLTLGQKDYATEPELVESWETSEDGLTWTFVLHDGLTWSDGEPLTADDFVWTANFVMENDISSWSDGYRFTESIEASDDRTIVWKTTRPTLVPGFPGYNLILPEHVWGEMSTKEIKEFRNYPDAVVSGPYELVEWEPGEFWRLEARDDYWRGAPAIDELVFRVYNSDESVVQALLKGEIDSTQVPTPGLFAQVEGRPGIGAAVTSAEAFHQMAFNIVDDPSSTAHPAVLDPVVRRAVSWAIDKDTLVDRVLRGYGEPGTTPIVPLYDFWHWEPPEGVKIGFDPAEANRLLEEAGYVDTDLDGIREMPGGGEPLEWRVFVATSDSPALKAAPFIQGWLEDVGIQTSVKSMTDSKLYDQWYDFDWDTLIYSWGTGPDPDFLLSSFTSDQCGYWSDTCYANPAYDTLYKQQQTTLDEDQRQSIVQEMQQMIYEDTPEIVLWYPNSFEAWRSDRWEGFVRWPEPDGVVFFGNPYSVMSVRPVSDAPVAAATDSGLSVGVWIGGLAVVGLGIGGLVLVRRRRGEHYA
ncbi:MAG: ABC transporter substrate-binding protein [Actinomycetota bacterium]